MNGWVSGDRGSVSAWFNYVWYSWVVSDWLSFFYLESNHWVLVIAVVNDF